MSWRITDHTVMTILVGAVLLWTGTNAWLSVKVPFAIGYLSESPLGIYRFRMVTYEVTDYGSKGNVGVIEKYGDCYDGIRTALGKECVYRTDRCEYPLRRDVVGIVIFFSYLASLAANVVLLGASLIIIGKRLAHRA